LPLRRDIVILGSGFAGSLLGRLLTLRGREVLLVERESHPRFALGESSTPLAAIALERLAERYDQPDLGALAAHGRWVRQLPELRCGLKRGFTFYRHLPDAPYSNGAGNEARLLVAASPGEEVADCQWMRADVDAHLVERARAAGVEYWDHATVECVEAGPDGLRLTGRRDGRAFDVQARFVVDGSGAGQVLARHLSIPDCTAEIPFSSHLLFAHFEGTRPFAEVAAEAGAVMSAGPYEDDWAAVHHLLEEGWMYSLRFDEGLVSAGILIAGDRSALSLTDPAASWSEIVGRYPTLMEVFREARPLGPGIRCAGPLPRRLQWATGERYALLPQSFAFFDPLFSTGLAWSLLGVERLADLLEDGLPSPSGLQRYDDLLRIEANHQQALVEAAYSALPEFDVFRSLTFLYFAAASFSEIRQRLLPWEGEGGSWAWEAFLGSEDERLCSMFQASAERARAALAGGRGSVLEFSRWVQSGIASRNLIGLGDAADHLYGFDLDALLEHSDLVGLSRREMLQRLPRLRATGP